MEINEEFNKRRKKFLQTGLAIVCILGGITGSIVLILAGIFILPAISDRLQKKLKYSDTLKWGIFAILFIIAVFTTDNSRPPQYKTLNENISINSENVIKNENIVNDVNNGIN